MNMVDAMKAQRKLAESGVASQIVEREQGHGIKMLGITARKTVGPVTGQPFWLVQVSDGKTNRAAFGRKLSVAMERLGMRGGVVV